MQKTVHTFENGPKSQRAALDGSRPWTNLATGRIYVTYFSTFKRSEEGNNNNSLFIWSVTTGDR